MDYQKLSEFRYLRDTTITLVARETRLSIQSIIQFSNKNIPRFTSSQAVQIFQDYFASRNSLFSNNNLLFPTDEGKLLLPDKYRQNFKRLLSKAGIDPLALSPMLLTDVHIKRILELQFQFQRPIYQMYLAAALIGYQALRPVEVAKLQKEDIHIDEEIIILRDTKSREDQYVIIYPTLIKPLKNYLAHIEAGEPLFIRASNKQWERKDVYRAIKNFCKHHGFRNINPRRFRATVATYMINNGIPINYVSKYLRHRDAATTIRHYVGVVSKKESRHTSQAFHSILSGQANSYHDFDSKQADGK